MKQRLLVLCLAFLLTFTACSTPQPPPPPPEESSVAPPPASSSQAGKNYWVTDVDIGIEDREAVNDLYWYLYGNLTPTQYNTISFWYATYVSNIDSWIYSVYVVAPSRDPIDDLLAAYTGSWAPVYYESCRFTEAERARAKEDLEYFLKEQPDVKEAVAFIYKSDFTDELLVSAKSCPDELAAFIENYPLKDLFLVDDWPDPDLACPD